jgi:prepilin-type N-terminal cleavage/methylation domain-containing protein
MHAIVYTLSRNCRWQPGAKGFTLIELAVAIAIITLLLGSLLVPLQTQVAQRQISDTQKALDDIKDALLGYAVTNGYLPCPDLTSGANSNDGQEDVSGGTCISAEGNLPWATLGIVGSDPWGNRFRYRVDPDYSSHSAPFSLTSSADLRVCTTFACTTLLTSGTAGQGAVAVILSHGKNGFGAINSLTNSANSPPSSSDEQENTNNNTSFVSRTSSDIGSTAGEFDDIATWLSKNTLFNRMVAAGKLP